MCQLAQNYHIELGVEVIWKHTLGRFQKSRTLKAQKAFIRMSNMIKFLFLNRSKRLVAYRQYTWMVHGYLGRHRRRAIPSCAVWRLRRAYPEADPRNYIGFEEAEGGIDPFWPG